MPDITAPVSIDGRTQPGWVVNSAIGAFNGTLCVRIVNGASATPLGGNTSEIGNAVADQTDAIYLNGFGPANGCQ